MKSLTESITGRRSGNNTRYKSYKDLLEPGDIVETLNGDLLMFINQNGNYKIKVPEDSFVSYELEIPISQYNDQLKHESSPNSIKTIIKTADNVPISRFDQRDLKEMADDCRHMDPMYGCEVIKVK